MSDPATTAPAARDLPLPREVDVVVVGAGQAGLSAAHFLAERGTGGQDGFVVLDADDAPGGAWQHRWESLTLEHVHGIHELPGMAFAGGDADTPANVAIPAYFARYEATFDLPVVRPVRVAGVHDRDDGRLRVATSAGEVTTRALINATGTWTEPFWPRYPGAETFRGRQLHTADYRSRDEFAGQHVVVVGGGASATQLLAELADVATTTWVTRRPPVWREGPFTEEIGRAAVAKVEQRVREGRPPESVVSVTGLYATPEVQALRDRGLERLPVFDRITPTGVAWDDGREVRADAILWATGFRAALDHLTPLRLREPTGGIRLDGTRAARDPRIHLLGYGPSASTIGANRAGRTAARDVRRRLSAAEGAGGAAATG